MRHRTTRFSLQGHMVVTLNFLSRLSGFGHWHTCATLHISYWEVLQI